MAKIQLTLSTNYVREWGIWEGIREIVQNALDADDDGHECVIKRTGQTLKVTSVGARLDKNVWLMGTSSKSSGGYRGHFGEGLKLGVLALVRKGCDVKIVNRDESWTPVIETSEVFDGEQVLTVHTRQRQNDTGSFTVEIGPVDDEAWDIIKGRFLKLTPAKNVISTRAADVLMDPDMQGRVFVKGIFVQKSPDLAVGYDFKSMATDRDRKMVDSWDLRSYAADAWEEAMTRALVPAEKVLDLMSSGAPDLAGIGVYSTTGAVTLLREAFAKEHGEDALPVTSMGEAREVEHYGKRGVVLPSALVEALAKGEGALSLANARKAHKLAQRKVIGWSDLDEQEQGIYTEVVSLVEKAAGDLGYAKVEDRLTIVEFGIGEGINGLHEGGAIKLGRHLLADFDEALRVLVHEVAHDKGGDGEKEHERAEGRLFARIVRNMKQAVAPAPAPRPKTSAPRAKAPATVDPAPTDALAVLADPTSTPEAIEAALALLR